MTIPEPGAAGYDAVVFDLGGVFTDSPFEALRRVGLDKGIAFDEALDVMFGPYHADTDHPWHRAERGELDLPTCRAEIRALAAERGHDLDLFDILAHMASDGGIRDDMVAVVRRIRDTGRRTALLTNNVAEFRPFWHQMLPFDELFDLVVDSSAVGLRKPDPAVYRHVLDGLGGVSFERSVFLDDFEGNVRAAEALGMAGIVVDVDPSAAIAELVALLGLDR
jgi:epoxide hydrolase-like predicted phosphatase